MTENIVTNKKYRILVDEVNDVWDRISFWSKASDVHFEDGTTAEMNRPVNVLQRNKAYAVGAVVYEPTAPSWVLLRCTVAGTTAPVTPTTYQTITSPGVVITDGSVGGAKFTVYDVRPNSLMSESAYQIPAMNVVEGLNSQLIADDGKKFQFAHDNVNDRYGFVIDGIFNPFGIVSPGTAFCIGAMNGQNSGNVTKIIQGGTYNVIGMCKRYGGYDPYVSIKVNDVTVWSWHNPDGDAEGGIRQTIQSIAFEEGDLVAAVAPKADNIGMTYTAIIIWRELT